jgi:hypothetical protein
MILTLLSLPDLKLPRFTVGRGYVIKGAFGNGLIVVADDGHLHIVLASRFDGWEAV